MKGLGCSRLFCFALLMALMEAMAMGEPQLFVVPKGGKIAVWEAEQAKSDGWIVVQHEWASGGAFVEPVEGHARPVLEFPFRTDRPITLQVFPLWWWHGEQKTATRFPSYLPYFRLLQIFEMAYPDPKGVTRLPFPVPARFGPDALDGDGKRLFFTAPEAGRIGVLDLTTERLVQVIEIGGYPTDLLVDRRHHCVYVADGLGNRIVALDAETGAKLREVGVPPMPYSLAEDGQHLFVACLMAKELVILETPSLHLVRRLPLSIGAHHVEVREGKVVVWLAPTAYDAKALTEDVPDRLAFYPLHVFPENIYEPPLVWQTLRALRKGGVVRLFARAPNFGSLWDGRFHVESQTAIVQAGEQPTQLQIRWMLNPPRETLLDIAALGLRVDDENALPDRYCVAGGKFFFTLPSLGKVVCHPLSPDAEPIVLDIGGFLSDMTAFSDGFWVGYRGFGYMPTGQPLGKGEPFGVPLGKYVDACLSFFPSPDLGRVYSPEHRRFPPKVYIADAQNHRVVVLDPQTLRPIKSIAVSEEPIALSLFGLELFVTCRKGREVFVVDIRTDEVVRRQKLPAEPIYADVAKFQPPYLASEFRPPAELDDAPIWFVAHYRPIAFRIGDWQPVESPAMALEDAILPRRRQRFRWQDGQGRWREVFADNMHTIRLDGERWLDVSEVTDPKRKDEPARLREGDLPGTITLSVDGSAEYDWMRGIWLTPRERRFLVNPPRHLWQTEPFDELADIFRRHNAPAFRIGAGEHVLRVTAHSPYACLDGLLVWATLEGAIEAQIIGSTDETSELPVSVFAADEPVRFTLRIKGTSTQTLKGKWQVLHPVRREMASGEFTVAVKANEWTETVIAPSLNHTGLFTLRIWLTGDEGGLLLERLFFKLPKLTHPRLLCRAEMLPAIRERATAHRRLFQRWRQWLERHVDDPDFLPSNWTGTGQNLGVELAKWRAIACLFAEWAVPRDDGQRPLLQKVLPLLKGRASASAWSSFQGDFQFGGALAVLYDFAIALEPSFALKVREQLRPSLLLERALPETLLLMDEPLTPTMRMVLRRHAVMLDNYLRYFQAHQGKTGGMLWQGLGAHCQCALHSIARSLLFWGNFLDDLSFLQDAFSKLYAHINYALPRYDHEGFLAKGGMKGDHPGTPGIDPKVGTLPMRWLLAHLCGEPMELASLNLTPMIRQLETATDEEAMRLFSDGANFVVPMWLALGIVDLKATKKRWDELPLSRCFETEGTACLKSDWSPTMTDIYFVSGVRDVAYRTQPNHLQIFKAGRVLFGTPVHVVDHGTPTPSWANAVVIGEGLPKEWAIAMGYGRMSERIIVNRFAPEVLGYAMRDFRLKGIEPESYRGWFAGGHAGPGTYDLMLHSHTRHPFLSQGAIIAFASQPDWDYVAGDATNVWRADEVREVYRQVVFVRPDLLIVFDRLQLRQPRLTQWLASTAPDVRIDKNTFVVTNKEAFLWGIVLSPERAKLQVDGVQNLPGGRKQNRLRIVPDGLPLSVNYLVVLRTGIGTPTPLSVQLVRESEMVGVKVPLDGQTVTALFRTEGVVGGEVRLERNGQRQVFPLPKPVGCAKMQAVR